MMGWLNIGSLVLGLIAWILPVMSIMRITKRWVALSTISLSACAISLIFQMYYNYHLVQIQDWSALMDTMGGGVVAATVLLIVTIALNGIALIVHRGRTVK